ncbi:MAG: hypothetical protein Q9191_007618, partial [Dirinaria sp. TL-2023a]
MAPGILFSQHPSSSLTATATAQTPKTYAIPSTLKPTTPPIYADYVPTTRSSVENSDDPTSSLMIGYTVIMAAGCVAVVVFMYFSVRRWLRVRREWRQVNEAVASRHTEERGANRDRREGENELVTMPRPV